ncbi:hypothetical protein AAHA92_02797 [Salvia divinorum]|uniref:VQ domain-containing protein n=1 Tax=Salvia divinorum TaxID=28513 RepID=A0ABD1IF16_SALDI
MGKKKSNGSTPMKSSKHVKKPQLTNWMKILRPKVYIIDTYNFKSLVQQLTGNGKYQEVPLVETYHQDSHHRHHNTEGMSVAASVEASPELCVTPTLKREIEIYKGLEAMLTEMDSDSCDNYDNIACSYCWK